MTFQVPWVISDVAEVPLEVARLLAYVATNGKEGIVGPGDLQVRSIATPAGSVRIAPGSFAAINNFVGNDSQTYLGYNNAEVTQAITATGGAVRSDLVYVRINDTGQTSGGVSGPASIVVAQGVSASVTTLAEVDPNIAGIALARIDMPASTSVVQQAYITDLRELVSPRRSELVKVASGITGPQSLSSASYISWPTEASWASIKIPTWAVRCQIITSIGGYVIYEGTAQPSGSNSSLRMYLGASLQTAAITANHSFPSGFPGSVDSAATTIAGDMYIPVADRGTTVTLQMQAKLNSNTNGSLIRVGTGTTVVAQVIFYEAADDQYWA